MPKIDNDYDDDVNDDDDNDDYYVFSFPKVSQTQLTSEGGPINYDDDDDDNNDDDDGDDDDDKV